MAESRTFRGRALGNGLVKLEIVLTADEADLVVQAVERAREAIAAKHTSGEASPAPRAADGLMELVASYLAGQTATDTAVAPKAEVVVHLERDLTSDTPGLIATLDDGTPVSAETLRRLACDGGLVPASIDEDHAVLDVGRRTRAIPTAIRRALLLRDHGCRFPGCASTRFLHGHHVQHWLHGGRTALSNLVLLCSFHHRLVHEGGFTISLTDTAEVLVRSPAAKTSPRKRQRPEPWNGRATLGERATTMHGEAHVGRRNHRLRRRCRRSFAGDPVPRRYPSSAF